MKMGKSTKFLWQFSIATLVITRGYCWFVSCNCHGSQLRRLADSDNLWSVTSKTIGWKNIPIPCSTPINSKTQVMTPTIIPSCTQHFAYSYSEFHNIPKNHIQLHSDDLPVNFLRHGQKRSPQRPSDTTVPWLAAAAVAPLVLAA